MSRDGALAVIESCTELDVRLNVVEDGRLAATGWLNDRLRAAIREHKDDIVALLRLAPVAAEIPSESALIYVPSLGREVWIASDPDEAERLRGELAREGDTRPVIVADEILKLDGQPRELIDATVTALAGVGGKVVGTATKLPPLDPDEGFAVYFVYRDGVPVSVFGDAHRGVAIGAKPLRTAADEDNTVGEVAQGGERRGTATAAGRSRRAS